MVVHYSIARRSTFSSKQPEGTAELPKMDAEERARRLTSKLKGLLSEEIAEHGGAEAFVRWIRSDDKEAA